MRVGALEGTGEVVLRNGWCIATRHRGQLLASTSKSSQLILSRNMSVDMLVPT